MTVANAQRGVWRRFGIAHVARARLGIGSPQ